MTAIANRQFFQHDELPNSETHFRLLCIKAAPRKKPTVNKQPLESHAFKCDLKPFPLEDSPPYRAVSYTWGDPKLTTWIQVNGQPMRVRWNCLYMLWQVYRHSGADRYVWVDAICINQNENQEKNHQVSRMGQIFKRAEHVLACIGEHDKDSRYLFDVLIRRSTFFARLSAKLAKDNFSPDSDFIVPYFLWRYGSPEPSKLLLSLTKLFDRRYFQRVWTLPELWLARSAHILCGEDYISARSIYSLYSTFDQPRTFEYDLRRLYKVIRKDGRKFLKTSTLQKVPYLVYVSFLKYAGPRMTSRLMTLRQDPVETALWPLIECGHLQAMAYRMQKRAMRLTKAMRIATNLECEDERDRIYAMIPIVRWRSNSIQPDYNIDPFDLAMDILNSAVGTSPFWECLIPDTIACLRLDDMMSAKQAQAINDRHHANPIRPVARMAAEGILPIKRLILTFYGFQLAYSNRWEIIDLSQHKYRTIGRGFRQHSFDALKQPHHLVTGDQGQLLALLPVCARPEDWIVGHSTFGFIIIRKHQDDVYRIVGEAYGHDDVHTRMRLGKQFRTHFDVGDLLVLSLQKGSMYSDSDLPYHLIDRSLQNAVCYAKGSSYAQSYSEVDWEEI